MIKSADNKSSKVILLFPDYRCGGVFQSAGLPVGLGYIAKALKEAAIDYEIVDLNIDSVDYLMDRIRNYEPRYLGISMMSYRCRDVYNLIHNIKDKFPNLTIVAGGPHVTANRESILIECPSIDVGVVGEGEVSFVELVHGNPPLSVGGILYREEGEVRFTGAREFISNLDEIPFPTYEGFKLEKYGKIMVLNSSRGCPYKCIFCGAPRILGKKWRKRSKQGMVEELDYWYKKGYRRFYISDSNFGVDKKRVLDFCDEIIIRNLDVTFIADGLRADHFNHIMLEKLKAAGFTDLTFGVESGSEKVLCNLKKGETCEQIESAIAIATDLGFRVTLFFLIGSPGENIEDIKQSFQLARKYNVANVYFFNLTPIPGTEFYDWAIEHGYFDETKEKYPEGNFGFSNNALFPTDVMTIEQLNRWIRQARRIERRIQTRYFIREELSRINAVNYFVNQGLINSFSWFISHPVITPVSRILWKVISLFRKRVNSQIINAK
jgi:anaerobic magnesium-protoporphyrin IX monomethyl ester cyclase